jgi:hypothetical protein
MLVMCKKKGVSFTYVFKIASIAIAKVAKPAKVYRTLQV